MTPNGRRIGTLIQIGGEPSADLDYPADNDYSWCCLGRTGYKQYKRDLWIEMLNDWEFIGPESERAHLVHRSAVAMSRCSNFSLEPTAALYVFDALGRFAAPWLRRGNVPGGCSSVLC
jgi:hypothetical protein